MIWYRYEVGLDTKPWLFEVTLWEKTAVSAWFSIPKILWLVLSSGAVVRMQYWRPTHCSLSGVWFWPV